MTETNKKELKIMLSSPMKGKTQEEIEEEREEMFEKIGYMDVDYVVMETVIKDAEKKSELECFSESIWLMSKADVLCMGYGWQEARGCRLEHDIAKAYNMPIIYLEDDLFRG